MLAMLPKLRRVALFNLRLAFPDWNDERRQEAIRSMSRYLGWQAVEFARFPQYNRGNIEQIIEIEGHENFLEAQRRGKGVLILTGQSARGRYPRLRTPSMATPCTLWRGRSTTRARCFRQSLSLLERKPANLQE